ncbi:hypothetical protein [Janibacter melonis]|uniref:hypothetical protein n=1 Tax=Janibacter melonis TaxID=262209 RepID=UPI0020950207|nr:hypothetical protein [Janibacter melonis]
MTIRQDVVDGPGRVVPRLARQGAVVVRSTLALRRLADLAEARGAISAPPDGRMAGMQAEQITDPVAHHAEGRCGRPGGAGCAGSTWSPATS